MKSDRAAKISKTRLSAFLVKQRKWVSFLGRGAAQAGFALAAFLLARVTVLESVSPFGLALVVGASDQYAFAALLGFVFNAWFGGSGAASSTFVAAAGVSATVRWIIVTVFKKYKRETFFPTLVAALVSLLVTNFSILFLTGLASWDSVGLLLGEAALVGAFSFFYNKACSGLRPNISIEELSVVQKASCAIAFCTIVMAVYPFTIAMVSVGRILAALASALAFYYLPLSVALAVAAAAGSGVMLSEAGFAFAAASIIISGALASLVKAKGRPIYCVLYLGAAALFAVCAGNYPFAIIYLFEIALAGLLFLLFPLRSPYVASSTTKDGDLRRSAARAVENRLCEISGAMKDISTILEKVSEPAQKISVMDGIYNRSIEKVCRNCPLMSYCWTKCYDETIEALGRLTPILQREGNIKKDDVLFSFRSRCINSDNLCGEINRRYGNYLDEQKNRRSTRLFRGILKRQFSALSQMLSATAQDLRGLSEWDERTSSQLFDCAVRLRIPVQSVNCVYDQERHPTITVDTKSEIDPTVHKRFLSVMSSIVGSTMAPPTADKQPDKTSYVYTEQPKYVLKTAVTQHPAVGDICGDVYSIFADQKGTVHMVLSDGMGTGLAAAKDGAVCCAFMRRLMENGFPAIRAAELANSTMAMKEDSERACTLDSLSFNMFTGAASIFKAGAAPTFVVRDNEIMKFSHPTLPVGILGEVVGKEFSLNLSQGDVVVMVSDGVISDDSRILMDLLRDCREMSPEELCRAVKERLFEAGLDDDDLTIMAAKVSANQKADE